MATVAKSFTAVGAGTGLAVKHRDSVSYSVSGTFVATVVFERSQNGGASWQAVATATGAASGTVLVENPDQGQSIFRFRCSAFTSGTIVTSIDDVASTLQLISDGDGVPLLKVTEAGVETLVRASQKLSVSAAGQAKVGGTSGWVVAAANNTALVTCPASQTGSTLVVPIPRLKVGDTITGFHLVGQIESAGGAVTVDADLRKMTAAAADVADASVGAITQLSVTADAIMSELNTSKASLSEVVGADETFYVLITATTAASTDIALQGVCVTVTEA